MLPLMVCIDLGLRTCVFACLALWDSPIIKPLHSSIVQDSIQHTEGEGLSDAPWTKKAQATVIQQS